MSLFERRYCPGDHDELHGIILAGERVVGCCTHRRQCEDPRPGSISSFHYFLSLFIAVEEPIVVAWRWVENRCGNVGGVPVDLANAND